MTRPDDVAEGVVWDEGRVVLVGDAASIRAEARRRGIDCEEAAGIVLPGFVDAHTHLLHQGMRHQRPDLAAAHSREEMLEILASWLRAHPGPGPVIGEGFDESAWSRPVLPTRGDLDAVCDDRPVAVRRVCGHVSVANSAALERVLGRWQAPEEVDRATGLLLEAPSLYLNEALPASAADMDRALEEACRVAHGLGVTAVGDYAQAPNRAALQRAAARGTLRLRVTCSIYVQQLDEEVRRGFRTGRRAVGPGDEGADPATWLPAVGADDDSGSPGGEAGRAGSAVSAGAAAPAAPAGRAGLASPADHELHPAPVPPAEGGTSPWLRDGGLKVFLDGSIGGHTALLRRPYDDAPGTGLRNWSDAKLDTFFRTATDAGIQVHAHAIGDGAIEQALQAYSRLPDGSCARLRHRVEHYELPTQDLVEQTVRLGVVASCQPNFVGEWSQAGGMYERRLGARFRDNNRYRSWGQQGLRICFGSDGMPFGPLYGIECAVMRPDAAERLTVAEALWRYTAEAAWSLHDSGSGRLVPGAPADLVVLGTDVLDGRPTSWKIQETFLDGAPTLSSATADTGSGRIGRTKAP